MRTGLRIASCLLCLAVSNITYSQNLNQMELNAAASQQLSASEFMLGKAYEQLMDVLDPDRKEQLEAAQQAWTKFRDLNAAVVSSAYEGGSIRPLIHTQALVAMTDNRTAELAGMHLAEITP